MFLTPLELAIVGPAVGYLAGRLHRHHVVTRLQNRIGRLTGLLHRAREQRDHAQEDARRYAMYAHPAGRGRRHLQPVPDTVDGIARAGHW